MTADIQIAYNVSGADLRAVVISQGGSVLGWRLLGAGNDFGVFSSIVSGSLFSSFCMPTINSGGMVAQGLYYYTNFPQGIDPGLYNVTIYDMNLNSGKTFFKDFVAQGWGQMHWTGALSGTKFVPSLSLIATSGLFAASTPVQIARSQMIENFPIYLRGGSDGITPLTSGTVSGQVARDGGLFTALESGRIVERGNGFYSVQALTSGDLNGDSVRLLFTGIGLSGVGRAVPLAFTFTTQGG